jgi:hypothetical protein
MTITRLLGGLGNQLFRYAAGRALSLARGQPLRLNVSGFANYGLHQGFELDRVFSCPEVHTVFSCAANVLNGRKCVF